MKICPRCGSIKENEPLYMVKYDICHKCRKEDKKKEYERDKKIILQKQKVYIKLNKNIISTKSAIYKKKHRDRIKLKNQQYNQTIRKERMRSDINFRLKELIRKRCYRAIADNRAIKSKKTLDLLGCTVKECRQWIEKQFKPGMSWDNMGEWHIDHIMPCAFFDMTIPGEQQKCFNYTNLQPLWRRDNILKSDKIECLTSEGIFLV